MLDIKRIRENPEEVAAALKKRNLDVDFTELLTLDKDRRALLQSVEEKKNDRNITSKKIPVMKKNGEDVTAELERMKKVGDEITEENNKVRDIEERIQYILDRLPNIPADDVVAGGKENNKVIKVFGEKPSFDFEPKNHVDLCKAHNLIDYERGVKLSGEGSWLYTGQGALLEWALLNFFIREHVKD